MRLRCGIRRLNEHNGVANTPTGGYHETITAAYVALIDAFLRRGADARDLSGAGAALLSGDLGKREILLQYWSREQLFSTRARQCWVEPDLLTLDET